FFMIPVIKMFSQIRMNNVPFISNNPIVAPQMNSNLTVKQINIPDGFVVTAEAFRIFLRENGLQLPLAKILEELDTQQFSNIAKIGKGARQLVLENELPHKLELEIRNAHYKLCGEETNVSVAIRSSATEDLPACGFTQQLDSFVNIKGEDALINAVHKCFASLFSERAIYDRHHKGINNADIAISIGVQKIVRADVSSSNLGFAVDPLKGFDKIMSFKTVEKA
ncbi:MAG: phosphoenolpyruvate synthase, partial [Segetibacter sp.]|nr:phosphoenolpyruvate synthase [Segetibacter sp.]